MSATPPVEVAIAVVEDGDRFLVGRRPDGAPLAGYWEFPGGKLQAGETPAQAAARECREETGIEIEVQATLLIQDFEYPHGPLRLYFFQSRPQTSTMPQVPFQWIDRRKLIKLEFPPANRAVLQQLAAEFGD